MKAGDLDFKKSYLICHRRLDRTFKIRNHYFPVCSRCTGFYIGAFLCFICIILFYIPYNVNFILFSILIMIPLFVDGITQFFGFRESNNILRFLTGLIAGLGIVMFIYAARWMIIMN